MPTIDAINRQLAVLADGRRIRYININNKLTDRNGALGTVTASQISHGRENDLWVEVDGTKGAVEWHQEEPNKLIVRSNGKPHQIYTRAGGPYLSPVAQASSRLPSGHPEAFFEAFANIYAGAIDAIRRHVDGRPLPPAEYDFPTVHDGVRGMKFIYTAVESAKKNGSWIAIP